MGLAAARLAGEEEPAPGIIGVALCQGVHVLLPVLPGAEAVEGELVQGIPQAGLLHSGAASAQLHAGALADQFGAVLPDGPKVTPVQALGAVVAGEVAGFAVVVVRLHFGEAVFVIARC